MARLSGQLISVSMLTCRQRSEMFDLMRRYYANMSHEVFESDLDEKQWVILITDKSSGAVRGFSTQKLIQQSINGSDVTALFSGDTIIDQRYWGQNPLAQLWGRFALSLIDAHPDKNLFWFLITKGYKTYRFLPVFFHEYYPQYDADTSDWAAELIDALAGKRFGKTYDRARRVVMAGSAGCQLRQGVANVTQKRLSDPHIKFFVELNPGHDRGDELCCIAPLSRSNFTPAAYRVIGTTAPELVVCS